MKETKKIAEQIRENYETTGDSKLDKLRKLDKKAKRPAMIFAYVFGTIGALVLGVGMCLAMKVIGDLMPLGIVIGCVGIAMVSVNYFIFNALLRSRKAKYREQILAISDDLIRE